MGWYEKEAAYARAYKEGKQARDLWKYIPGKVCEGVDWTNVDEGGYWIYLKDGWVAYDGGEDCCQVHEYNVADLRNAIKTIRRVS